MLPLARPALATLVLVNAIYVWNELLIALILLQKNELKTLMVGLHRIQIEIQHECSSDNGWISNCDYPTYSHFPILVSATSFEGS